MYQKLINVKRGAYVLNTTSHDNKVTLIASGSEVKIALDVQNLLKENNIESKVISMPCQELFDDQIIDYKNQLIDNALIVSLEAGDTLSWKKYTEKKDITFGINNFGKSAPYKKNIIILILLQKV